MNHIDSLITDPRRGSNTVARCENQSFIPVGDANGNYATATRLKIQIPHHPTGLDSLQESVTRLMNYLGSSVIEATLHHMNLVI